MSAKEPIVLQSLSLTNVLYDPNDHVAHLLALLTLSPILLIAMYAGICVLRKDALFINMFLGQLGCEAINWVLKRSFKHDRPLDSMGTGYGFPSSHSQFMGYFAAFLTLHLWLRETPLNAYQDPLSKAKKIILFLALPLWAGAVCYSRWYLTYHTVTQIAAGAAIGVAIGSIYYTITEYIPYRYPLTLVGRVRNGIIESDLASRLRVRDGWAVWADGGEELEWGVWRAEWDKRRKEKKMQ